MDAGWDVWVGVPIVRNPGSLCPDIFSLWVPGGKCMEVYIQKILLLRFRQSMTIRHKTILWHITYPFCSHLEDRFWRGAKWASRKDGKHGLSGQPGCQLPGRAWCDGELTSFITKSGPNVTNLKISQPREPVGISCYSASVDPWASY